jgi:hypothetical protein
VLRVLTKAALVVAPVAGAVAAFVLLADGDGNSAQDPGPPVSEIIAVRFPAAVKPERPDSVASSTERGAQSLLDAVALSPSAFVAALDALVPPPDNSTQDSPPPVRADAVFNEAQIASFKTRIKITADQEASWRPVEAALRALSWQRGGGRGSKAKLDPDGVQRLGAATSTLFAILKDAQRREVRLLANVVGLKT